MNKRSAPTDTCSGGCSSCESGFSMEESSYHHQRHRCLSLQRCMACSRSSPSASLCRTCCRHLRYKHAMLLLLCCFVWMHIWDIVGVNHGYVETVHFFRLQVYFPILCYVNGMLMVWLGLGRKDTWLDLGQENVFGLKYLVQLPQTGLEKSQHLILCGFCDHKHSCKLCQSLSRNFQLWHA